MSEQGEPRPRRALPARDEERASGQGGSGPRRGAPAAGPTRSAGAVGGRGAAPEPSGSGRRFASPEPATPSASEKRGWNRRRWVVGIASVVVLALLLGGAWLAQRAGLLNPGAQPTSTPTPSVDAVATYLAQPEDLSGLSEGTTWQVAATATTVDATTPQAKCVLPTVEQPTRPVDAMVRTFAAGEGQPGAVLYQVSRFDTPETAHTAYADLAAQLGNCERATALAQNGLAFAGLSDEAAGQIYVVQDAANEYHTIAVSRTGARVNIIDATHTESAIKGEAVAGVLSDVALRQCTDGGTCPGQVSVTSGVPLPSTPAGWLAAVDLPRITPGAGSWRGTDVADSVSIPGTKCEALDLAGLPGASTRQQRTYLLRDDTAAPQNFGVDEALYTFATPEEAQKTFSTLAGNMDGCTGRAATAQVNRTGDPSGAGTAAAWTVVQKVDQASATAMFRSGALVSGNHVVYLVANPSGTFDFSNESWHAVVNRAGERVTQLP